MIGWWLIGVAWAAPVDGVVHLRGSGDPLEGVVVRAGAVETATDEKGRFHLDVPDGIADLTFESPGHLPATIPVQSAAHVWLVPVEGPLEIVVEAFKATPHPTRHVIDAEIAYKTPGTLDDAVRLVQSLPSVAIQREYSPSAGDLSIRGASAGDNRYYLDGVELPYLYHYNQYASVFPTTQIAQLELFPSTFGASYGDAVGGIIEATSKTAAPKAVHGVVSANLLMGGVQLQAPLTKKLWISAAGRRSYYDFVTPSTPQYTLWPIFGDFSVRLQNDLPDGHVAAFALGASDAYSRIAGELDVLDPVEAGESPGFDYKRGFQIVGAERRWTTPAFTARINAAYVDDLVTGQLGGGGGERLHTQYGTSRFDASGKVAKHLGYGVGWEMRGEQTALEVVPAGPNGLLVAEESPALARNVAVDDKIGRLRSAVYGEAHLDFGPVRIYPGVRAGLDSVTGASVDPRLAVRWHALDQTEIKLAAGRYHQAPDTAWLFAGTGDPTLPQTTSWSASVGIEQTIADRIEISLDLWAKELDNMVTLPVGELPVVVDKGRGRGAELVMRYRLRETFFIWGWVGVAHTVALTDAGPMPVDGDQPLTVGLVSSWDVADHWNLGLRYRYGSGLPYTPLEGAVYNATNDSWEAIRGDENSARLPDYQKVDAHVARSVDFKRWKLVLAAEVGIVPKQNAQLYPTWNYDYSEMGWVRGPVFLPLISGRAEF